MMKIKMMQYKANEKNSPKTELAKRSDGGYEILITFPPELIKKVLDGYGDIPDFSLEKTLTMTGIKELIEELLFEAKSAGHFYHMLSMLHRDLAVIGQDAEEAMLKYVSEKTKEKFN